MKLGLVWPWMTSSITTIDTTLGWLHGRYQTMPIMFGAHNFYDLNSGPIYRSTPRTTHTFIHCSTYVKEGVRVINGYINQNIFTSMLWTCGAWWKIRWWVPIVYWPVTMTKLWWLPFWYLGCPRSCLKIDFSRTVNWYHLHSDSEHYKHCTI